MRNAPFEGSCSSFCRASIDFPIPDVCCAPVSEREEAQPARGRFMRRYRVSWGKRGMSVIVCAIALVAAGSSSGARQADSAQAAVIAFPSHVNFGHVWAGQESMRTITFTNVGAVPVTLGPVGIFDLEGGGFGMQSDDCGGEIVELAPGQSCSYVIRFAPAMGSDDKSERRASELRFATSAGDSSVRLKGIAAAK